MDFRYTEEEERFRQRLREFLDKELTEEIARQNWEDKGICGGGREFARKLAMNGFLGMSWPEEVAVAKAWVSEAYRRVCLLGHQVFAGVGYMIDHDMPLYSTRAKAAELVFGDASFYQEIVAQELGL